jgi:ADP-dependent NAD(P)H-hydrate dehydratase / NAD(P)H-hydrate epimerase
MPDETMLEPLYTADEMRAAEERYPGFPESAPELMERAGSAVAREVLRAFPDARRLAVVCGEGSNGGDGRIAARVLREAGREAVETTAVEQADLIVDALFGTGFRGEPREEAAATIERINAAGAPVVAVDLPSGIDASTGGIAGTAVRADLTVTFHGCKLGLAVAPGRFNAGEVVIVDIGLDEAKTGAALVLPEILELVPRKQAADNKYSAGSVLVVGGAPGLTGAVCLAAEAAFRADAGYVAVAVPAASLPTVEAKLLEPVKLVWDDLFGAAERADAIALGPGLGRTAEAKALVARALAELEQPIVVDADALDGLEPGEWRPPVVLTPHAGELGRLLGESSDWVGAHRLEAARRAAELFGCVCLLKGADTIVAAPGARTLVCPIDAPALATAGTGDVLTGILAAFLAKGVEPRLAAAAAATAHGLAARAVPHATGVVASDVIAAIPSTRS